jgi:hypothetical protein
MDLTEINENPNGVSPNEANPNLVLSTVLTGTATYHLNFGFGIASGLMQHTQNDAKISQYNNYDWNTEDWGAYYSNLRNNNLVYEIAVRDNLEFHQGVALVMKSFLFGQITDIWGDAPYTEALKANLPDNEILLPKYDNQEVIYKGIIEDLKVAEILLSKDRGDYKEIYADTDVFFAGNPLKWRKFANSLMLRYYMRLSEKLPAYAEAGIKSIVENNKPIFESNLDDVLLDYVGNGEGDSWPTNSEFKDEVEYRHIKMCRTLVEEMRATNDPRLRKWAERVTTPTRYDDNAPEDTKGEIIKGIRYLNPSFVDENNVNTNNDYVGIPPSLIQPSAYNYNPTPGPESYNNYVSFLNDMYMGASGSLLKARLISYSEVNFILAEAAQRGWISGAEDYYNEAIRSSLYTWKVGSKFNVYISQPLVEYDGTLERIINQKWIASWSNAQEAWYDYRRTGFPVLTTGPAAKRSVLPLRYAYGNDEMSENNENYSKALESIELTIQSNGEKNSPWSKSWLFQGTNKPW